MCDQWRKRPLSVPQYLVLICDWSGGDTVESLARLVHIQRQHTSLSSHSFSDLVVTPSCHWLALSASGDSALLYPLIHSQIWWWHHYVIGSPCPHPATAHSFIPHLFPCQRSHMRNNGMAVFKYWYVTRVSGVLQTLKREGAFEGNEGDLKMPMRCGGNGEISMKTTWKGPTRRGRSK